MSERNVRTYYLHEQLQRSCEAVDVVDRIVEMRRNPHSTATIDGSLHCEDAVHGKEVLDNVLRRHVLNPKGSYGAGTFRRQGRQQLNVPKCLAEKELSDISRLCISVCD